MRPVLLALLLAVAPVLPATGGTITGRVVFRGEIPKLAPIHVVKDQAVCGDEIPTERLIVSPMTRGVQHAIIYLDGAVPPAKDAPPGEVVLENRACRFVPHVLAVRVGTELAIANADPVLHNVRAWMEARAVLNVVQPFQGQVTRRKIKRPGVMRLTCDIHVHMLGYLLAFEHPYFAMSDSSGEFRIPDVPPGTYRISAWHEGWAEVGRDPEGHAVYEPPHLLSQEVVVPKTGEVRVLFELTSRP